MDGSLARFATGSNPFIAAGIALVGGLVGGGIYGSISGAVLGLLIGLGVAGVGMLISWMAAKATGGLENNERPSGASPVASKTPIQSAAAAGGIAGSGLDSGAVVVSTVPAEAGVPLEVLDVTQSEAQLLAAGRFDHYHLAKAKRLFEAKNFKEAAYQAAASLSHGTLAEAAALRKSALALVVR